MKRYEVRVGERVVDSFSDCKVAWERAIELHEAGNESVVLLIDGSPVATFV